MINLTTPQAVPNITRIRLAQIFLFDALSLARCSVELLSPGATPRVKSLDILVRNGQSTSIVVDPSAVTFDGGVIQGGVISTPTGYDIVEAAYRGASKAAGIRAVESALLSLGCIDAALTGVVS